MILAPIGAHATYQLNREGSIHIFLHYGLRIYMTIISDDNTVPQSHLDFQRTPPEFISDDTTQDDALPHPIPAQYLSPKDCEAKYRKMRPTPTLLSKYRQWYENDQVEQAIASLSYRGQLMIDDEYIVVRNDVGDLLFTVTDKQFLDFLLIVGSTPGFRSITPALSQRLNFPWHLDLRRTAKIFTCRDFELGIDPTHAMMWIGKLLRDDVWLVLTNSQYLDYNRTASDSGGSTVIPDRARKLLVYLLLSALASSPANRFTISEPVFTSTIDDVSWDLVCNGFKYV
jgi:hypothetical protein